MNKNAYSSRSIVCGNSYKAIQLVICAVALLLFNYPMNVNAGKEQVYILTDYSKDCSKIKIEFSYNEKGLLSEATDPDNRMHYKYYNITYNSANQVESYWFGDSDGEGDNMYVATYNDRKQIERVLEYGFFKDRPPTRQITYKYDAKGRICSQSSYYGTSETPNVSKYKYNKDGLISSLYSVYDGQNYLFYYDSHGNIINANNVQPYFNEYNNKGLLTKRKTSYTETMNGEIIRKVKKGDTEIFKYKKIMTTPKLAKRIKHQQWALINAYVTGISHIYGLFWY